MALFTSRRRPPLSLNLSEARPHEAFELRRELLGDLLPIEHQPDHAHDEQHQRGQGQGGVIGQRGG